MKNFLFDLYGTLIDIRTDEESDGFWEKVARLLCAPDGAEVKRAYASLCRSAAEKLPEGGEIDLLAVFSALLGRFAGQGCIFLGDAAAFAHAFRDASMHKLRLFEGVEELIRGIHVRGGRAYLLSNAQACFTRRELDMTGIAHAFDGILLSSEAGFKKPSPVLFSMAFDAFSLCPEESIYVGNDLRDDVGGAHAAGLKCVYIETEQSGRYKGAPAPDYFAHDRASLARILFALAEGETP